MKRCNLLFIMTDEQRFDAVGYQNPCVKTPNLDALAEESVVFDYAYTTNPSCIPARAAIFTGRYPSQCGAPCYITPLPKKETTFMKLLQEGGYYTAVVGKQHFWKSEIEKGYDYMDIVDNHFPPAVIDDKVRESDFGLPANLTVTDQVPSYIRFLWENGFKKGEELFEEIDDGGIYRWKEDEKYYVDAYIGDKGVKWLKNKKPADRPWFLTLSFPGPHMPFDGIGLPDDKLYDEEDMDMPQTEPADILEKPPHFKNIFSKYGKVSEDGRSVEGGLSESQIRKMRKAYYANVSLIDRKIGEVIEVLKKSGEYENTLIIYTSDHGDYMGDFGVAAKAQYLSEVLMRIPFLLKPPIKDFKGYHEKSFVSSVEIAATFLTAGGIAVPDNMQGRSLTGFYEGVPERQDDIYMEARDLRGIRTKDFKLVFYAEREYGELYDMNQDPWERHNLWDHPAQQKTKQELLCRLMNHMVRLGENSQAAWNVGAPEI